MKLNTLAVSLLFAFPIAAFAEEPPKNIIYMIGDGMGPAFITGYRYYSDSKETKHVERTIFDELLVGSAQSFPDDDTYVTDSAAGATALATATKTYNGAIAVDRNKKPLKTMLQMAKAQGMSTGLVSTSQVVHATPASFAAHNESRRNYNQIADHYIDVKIDEKLPVDVILGGGKQYFKRDDRDLVSEFIEHGYTYSETLSDNTLKTRPALGLYADVAFDYAIDTDTTRLQTMTSNALSLLSKDNANGFFVMIEGSQIDWCAHANDIACAMAEMKDFDNAIQIAKAYVDNNPDTLLVVTADHSTGGLTLGANGIYKWHTDVISGVTASVPKITGTLLNTDEKNLISQWGLLTNIELTKEELVELSTSYASGEKAVLGKTVNKFINRHSNTGWTTTGHTAVDVPVLAYGRGYEVFIGNQNNTDIADKLIKYISQ